LKTGHQLILIDSRGHGQSDKPHDAAAYDLALRTSDVVAVLDQLGHQKADFLGYSLGGWVGFGLAKHAPERISSFIIGAAHPFAEDLQHIRDLVPSDREAYAAQLEKFPMPKAWRDRLLRNDPVAIRALTQDRVPIPDVFTSMRMPCLLFVGELDPRLVQMRECLTHLWDVSFFIVPGTDHITTAVRGDFVIPRVKAFLDQVARA
jgi:pimeloyl-ACP methyl ester carboxylesterase